MKIKDLQYHTAYKIKDSDCLNQFVLTGKFHPNKKCFRRVQDGMMHFGREFLGFEDGKPALLLEAGE